MKFENTRVWGFESALRGMRNPKNSWHLGDTGVQYYNSLKSTDMPIEKVKENYPNAYYRKITPEITEVTFIGPNDMKLAQNLIKAGSEHRKFLRQIFVSVDITAPLYWWKEFDTYKVGTVANSTSTMHKIQSAPINLGCFEIDDFQNDFTTEFETTHNAAYQVQDLLRWLESMRLEYNKTKDVKYWKELIRWLPESWMQKRTVTMSYENLLAICSKSQRRFHKLTEWRESFISWARSLPYAQDFIFIDELETKEEKAIKVKNFIRDLLSEGFSKEDLIDFIENVNSKLNN